MSTQDRHRQGAARPTRRAFLGATASAPWLASACSTAGARGDAGASAAVLVGSTNALPGMRAHFETLLAGADPLDVVIEVLKIPEADPEDRSVGLGGLPNEDGVVQLDAAVMHGPTHNAGGVAALENILHACEVARLVMERTDHCLLVGRGAYEFARAHGHPHVELLTEESRRIWLDWKERLSERDDRFPPAKVADSAERPTGTVHCSALAPSGDVACGTTTSGLAFKIPGRVGDSPLVGSGLYCDQEAGSAGGTGRGEAAILAHASSAIVELLRQGVAPREAGLEVLRRVTRQAQRAARWQPALVDQHGVPAFGLELYAIDLAGRYAGVTLRGGGEYAVADRDAGPRLEPLVALYPG